MASQTRDFSHVANFTDYMAIAVRLVLDLPGERLRILDMPAGNGLVSAQLRERGHDVTSADINSERPDYVYVNMEQPLPFDDASFDVVVCLEGIEHVVEPHSLIREICRVVKPGGHIVVSTPNVQSLYSRLEFLLTGTSFQFDPRFSRHPRGRLVDRGHISPVSLARLHYLFAEHHARLVEATGDRIKRKVLLPVYGLLWGCNLLAARLRTRKLPRVVDPTGEDRDLHTLYRIMTKARPMMSRSLVACWQKLDAPDGQT